MLSPSGVDGSRALGAALKAQGDSSLLTGAAVRRERARGLQPSDGSDAVAIAGVGVGRAASDDAPRMDGRFGDRNPVRGKLLLDQLLTGGTKAWLSVVAVMVSLLAAIHGLVFPKEVFVAPILRCLIFGVSLDIARTAAGVVCQRCAASCLPRCASISAWRARVCRGFAHVPVN
jgi:hypothetical protein